LAKNQKEFGAIWPVLCCSLIASDLHAGQPWWNSALKC
jgi:hypothetical protein